MKKKSYYERNEVVRLENEIVIFEIVFGTIHGWPYKGFQNIPHIRWMIKVVFSYTIMFSSCELK